MIDGRTIDRCQLRSYRSPHDFQRCTAFTLEVLELDLVKSLT